MKKAPLILTALALVSTLLFAACGQTASSAPAPATSTAPSGSAPAAEITLKVGATPAPHAEILEQVKPLLEKQGIILEIVEFSDYPLINPSVADKSLDANYFQHLPYLEDFNAKNGDSLTSAGSIHIEPMGVYPGKQTSLDSVPDGANFGVPNDATNEGRALLLLQSLGLITLTDGIGLSATPLDIKENPKNLKFTELDAAQLPNSLPDFDYAVINGNYAIGAGIGDTVLETEGADSPYVNIVAVRKGDESRPEIQALVAALQSEEIRTFINDTYTGSVIPVF